MRTKQHFCTSHVRSMPFLACAFVTRLFRATHWRIECYGCVFLSFSSSDGQPHFNDLASNEGKTLKSTASSLECGDLSIGIYTNILSAAAERRQMVAPGEGFAKPGGPDGTNTPAAAKRRPILSSLRDCGNIGFHLSPGSAKPPPGATICRRS